MSGTNRRWGSLSASAARAGEGGFLASASGRGSGSGLAGREQGCRVLGEQSEAAAVPGRPWRAREPRWAPWGQHHPPGPSGHPTGSARHRLLLQGRPGPPPRKSSSWSRPRLTRLPQGPSAWRERVVRDLARGADALAEAACLRMGPRGLHAFLSQRKETPRSYKIWGSDTGGVSRGPPHQQKSVDPKGPESLLCHRFSTIPFATGKAFRSVF